MNILGISGSLKKNGNTAFSVQYALNAIKDKKINTQYLSLSGKNIAPCDGCWACADTRKCKYEDDMMEILDQLRWCHGVIIGSPVYFGMVSGTLKNMMDRCVPFRPKYNEEMELSGKVGGGIACGGFRNGGQETTLQNIHTFLLQQNMRVINDGKGFSHAGAAVAGEAKDDNLGLQTVENLARNLVFMLKQPGL